MFQELESISQKTNTLRNSLKDAKHDLNEAKELLKLIRIMTTRINHMNSHLPNYLPSLSEPSKREINEPSSSVHEQEEEV